MALRVFGIPWLASMELRVRSTLEGWRDLRCIQLLPHGERMCIDSCSSNIQVNMKLRFESDLGNDGDQH